MSRASSTSLARLLVEADQPTIAPGVHVDDERDVDDAGPGGDIGEVGDPPLVRAGPGEVPLQQVGGSFTAVADGGANPAAAAGSLQAQIAHQAGDRAAGRGDALAVQLPPDLPDPVDAEVPRVDPADVLLQLRVPGQPRALGGRFLAT